MEPEEALGSPWEDPDSQVDSEIEASNQAFARRHRIDRIKQGLVIGFLVVTVFPTVLSAVLLAQVESMRHKVEDYLASGAGDATYVSSGQALMSNPNVDLTELLSEGTEEVAPAATEGSHRVYLTFDDGPSVYTGQILDILAANDVKATFFVIGKDDPMYAEYYERIVAEGHTLGMHSYTHDYNALYASEEAFTADLDRLSDFLTERTGVTPTCYRFPGGSSNRVSSGDMKAYIRILNDRGIRYYDWNAMSGDAVAEGLTPEQLADNVINGVHQNEGDTIVLMHDMQLKHEMVEALQPIIDTLKQEGYEILPIDEDTPLIQHVPYDTVGVVECYAA